MVVAVAFVLAGTSCSSGSGAETLSTPAGARLTPSPNESEDKPVVPGATESEQRASSSPDHVSSNRSDAAQATELQPLEFPHETTVRVRAAVSPKCAARGDVVAIRVEAPPGAAIAYQAVYSDNQGGADGLGAGYGGNDHGEADVRGTFKSSWVVKPHAPSGRGRVDVVVGFEGEWGYADPHFAVADSDGRCPDEWLGERGHEG